MANFPIENRVKLTYYEEGSELNRRNINDGKGKIQNPDGTGKK